MGHSRRSSISGYLGRGIYQVALVGALVAAFVATAAAAPTPRSFDLVTYAPPPGFTIDESSPDRVGLTRVGSKSYCRIGIYRSVAAHADLDASFAAEWQAVVSRTVAPVAAPAPTASAVGTAQARIGGAMSRAQGQPVFVVLAVVDAGTSVVSIVMLTPSPADFEIYGPAVRALLDSISVRRREPPAPATGATAGTAPPAIPPPARPLTLAMLAGEWKHDSSAMTRYVNRTTGDYAGYESIATKETWTITSSGVLTIAARAIASGIGGARAVSEKRVAAISVSPGGVLTIDYKPGEGADQKYQIRGWLVGPDLTILKLNGPHYGEIPDRVRDDPGYAPNLNELWVRKTQPARAGE